MDADIAAAAAARARARRALAQRRHAGARDDPRRAACTAQAARCRASTFDVERYDARGRELEWSWNINGGLWRPFTSAQPAGHQRHARSRGRASTRSASSRASRATTARSSRDHRDAGRDRLGRSARLRRQGDVGRRSAHGSGVGHRRRQGRRGRVRRSRRRQADDRRGSGAQRVARSRDGRSLLADNGNGEIAVFARDETGNQTIALVAPFHGQAGASGCSCETRAAPRAPAASCCSASSASACSAAVAAARSLRASLATSRACPHAARCSSAWSPSSSLVPGCSCGKQQAQSCETAADCGPDFCPKGELPFCIDNTCVCSDDIPPGRIGPYSDVAVGGGGRSGCRRTRSRTATSSSRKATGGRIPDEAWEWVDGVPDGPVVVPDSKIRGGIDDDGPDVGMYTSIAVAPRRHADGHATSIATPRRSSSPRKVGGVWQTHIVEQGTSKIDPGAGGSLVGMYTSLTLRTDDGRPGIAYLAHVADATGDARRGSLRGGADRGPDERRRLAVWTVDTAPRPREPGRGLPAPGRPRSVRRLGAQPAEPGARRRRTTTARTATSSSRSSTRDSGQFATPGRPRRHERCRRGLVAVGRGRRDRRRPRRLRRRDRRRPQVHDRRAERDEGDRRQRLPHRRHHGRRSAQAGVPLRRRRREHRPAAGRRGRWSSTRTRRRRSCCSRSKRHRRQVDAGARSPAADATPWPGAYGFFASARARRDRHRDVDAG